MKRKKDRKYYAHLSYTGETIEQTEDRIKAKRKKWKERAIIKNNVTI